MKEYFKKFPKINYQYTNSNNIVSSLEVVDLSIRFKIIERILDTPNSYYEYYWRDEDRIDIVADKYYGDPTLSWVVMLSAEAFDWIYDLPLTEEAFDVYLQNKYNVTDSNVLRSMIHHYKDISGSIIDIHTYMILSEEHKEIVSVYDYEYEINQKKRNIKLLSKVHLKDVLNEFDVKLQEIKNNRRLFKQG